MDEEDEKEIPCMVMAEMVVVDGSAESFLTIMGLLYSGLHFPHVQQDLVPAMRRHNLDPQKLVGMHTILGEIIEREGLVDKRTLN